MNEERLVKKIWLERIAGRRRTGGPKGMHDQVKLWISKERPDGNAKMKSDVDFAIPFRYKNLGYVTDTVSFYS